MKTPNRMATHSRSHDIQESALHDRFIAELKRGAQLEEKYARAFATVDRGDFVPVYYGVEADARLRWPIEWTKFSRTGDGSELWAQNVYSSERALVTRLSETGVPLVSSTDPQVMAVMIRELRPQDGDKVLEVGTGTGYNAAILSEVVGKDGAVTSVDIDEEACASAAGRLAGRTNIHLAQADGRLGYTPNAPYDCIVVTGNAARVEQSWLSQLTPAGRLVVHLKSAMVGGIFAATAAGDGVISGRFLDYPEIGFIALHDSGGPAEERDQEPIGELGDRLTSQNILLPAAEALLDDSNRDAHAFMGLLTVPDRYQTYEIGRPGDWYRGAVIARGRLRTELREEHAADDGKKIAVAGDESVLAELCKAFESWTAAGSPEHWQLEFTISAERVRFRTKAGSEFGTSAFTPIQRSL
jgi:protein-L-isoaspartate O-methyltransferase